MRKKERKNEENKKKAKSVSKTMKWILDLGAKAFNGSNDIASTSSFGSGQKQTSTLCFWNGQHPIF